MTEDGEAWDKACMRTTTLVLMLLGGMAGLLAPTGCVGLDADEEWMAREAKPVVTLVPGESGGRAVFMGFDFDAPMEWERRDIIGAMYMDRCEDLGVGYSFFQLNPPWHGFGKVLAWGEEGTNIVQGLKFQREEPMSFDWHGWAENVVRSFREDLGMEMRLLEPDPYGGYDAQYAGGEGELLAFLSVVHVTRFETDGIRVKSRLLEVKVRRFDSTIPDPAPLFEE